MNIHKATWAEHLLASTLILLTTLTTSTQLLADEFPLRAKFSEVTPISGEALNEKYNDYTIVDARSAFEFDTIHIAKAINIPVASKSFDKLLAQKVAKDAPVAFYCNGITCTKSYKAARKAASLGYTQARVYDAGIFTWIKTYPQRASLIGTTPADPAHLISKADLQAKMVDFAGFQKIAKESGNTVLIDVRDPYQRTLASDRSKKIDLPAIDGLRPRNIPLDRMGKMLKSGQMKDKTLLIYDAVGKQVRWLQYHLEGNGYGDYYFLNKGVFGVTGIVNK